MSEAYKALVSFAEKGQLSTNDKRWFTQKIREERQHERIMKLTEWFIKDSEAKYYAGVAFGAGTALAGTFLEQMLKDLELDISGVPGFGGEEPPTGLPVEGPSLPRLPWYWIFIDPFSGAAVATQEATDPTVIPAFGDANDIGGSVPQILKLGGAGFAGFCASVLLLKAMFSGTDLGEIAQAIAEGAPL